MYAKIFDQIFDSSISEDYVTRHVFMDLLVMADVDGTVDMTFDAISRRTCVPLEIVTSSIDKLMQPDPRSRSTDHGGRRLIPLDTRGWGWQIVNYKSYRGLKDEKARREYFRDYRRKRRQELPVHSVHNVAVEQTCEQLNGGVKRQELPVHSVHNVAVEQICEQFNGGSVDGSPVESTSVHTQNCVQHTCSHHVQPEAESDTESDTELAASDNTGLPGNIPTEAPPQSPPANLSKLPERLQQIALAVAMPQTLGRYPDIAILRRIDEALKDGSVSTFCRYVSRRIRGGLKPESYSIMVDLARDVAENHMVGVELERINNLPALGGVQ